MTTLADLDLDRLEELAEKATPGPWAKDERYIVGRGIPGERPGGEVIAECSPTRSHWAAYTTAMRIANAEFVAEFRNAVPSLLAAARAVQRVEALFSGGPDTACRTVWQDGIECVSVPIADLRAALGGAE